MIQSTDPYFFCLENMAGTRSEPWEAGMHDTAPALEGKRGGRHVEDHPESLIAEFSSSADHSTKSFLWVQQKPPFLVYFEVFPLFEDRVSSELETAPWYILYKTSGKQGSNLESSVKCQHCSRRRKEAGLGVWRKQIANLSSNPNPATGW